MSWCWFQLFENAKFWIIQRCSEWIIHFCFFCCWKNIFALVETLAWMRKQLSSDFKDHTRNVSSSSVRSFCSSLLGFSCGKFLMVNVGGWLSGCVCNWVVWKMSHDLLIPSFSWLLNWCHEWLDAKSFQCSCDYWSKYSLNLHWFWLWLVVGWL